MQQTAQEIKDQLKDIYARRELLEEEIAVSSARLLAANVGMDAPLLDIEGFPRSDIDIPAIRADRHKVITLNNDHKELTDQLDMLLTKLHAMSREEGAVRPLTPQAAATPYLASTEAEGNAVAISVDSRSTRPFAVVDEVAENSPASEAGIQLRDELVRFGNVTGQTPNSLQEVAKTLQASDGRRVEAEFLRDGKVVALIVEPRTWSGRGLLGCHLMPL